MNLATLILGAQSQIKGSAQSVNEIRPDGINMALVCSVDNKDMRGCIHYSCITRTVIGIGLAFRRASTGG